MKRELKRILSLFLCIVMCLSQFPMNALAEGGTSNQADYSAVWSAIARYEELNESYYMSYSWGDLTAAIGAVVFDLEATQQDDVDQMAIRINDAIDALEFADADYTAVEEAIYRFIECEQLKYTLESWQAVENAIANVIRGLKIDKQAEVDQMATEIDNAINALELQHVHDFTGDYMDNGDGTHSRACIGCDQYGNLEAHSFTDSVCVCGAKDPEAELAAAKEAAGIAIRAALEGYDKPVGGARNAAMNCLNAIINATTVDEVNTVLAIGLKAIQDEMADEVNIAKGAAEDAIRAAAGNYGANVNKIMMSCLFAINQADTVEEVNAIRDNGIAKIKAAVAEKELAEAKEAAKSAINSAAGDDTSENVQQAANDAIADIESAATVDEVNAARDAGIKAIQAAQSENELAAAKEAALSELTAEVGDDPSIKRPTSTYLNKVRIATTIDELNAAFDAAMIKVKQLKAVNTIYSEVGNDRSENVQQIEDDAVININNATTFDEINAALEAGIKAIRAARSSTDLAAAKEEAIAKINAQKSAAKCDEAKNILNQALADLDNATTIDAVNSIMSDAIEAARDKDIAFENECFEYINSINDIISDKKDVVTEETKAFADKVNEELANATTVEQLKDIFDSNIDTIKFYCEKDNVAAYLNEILSSDESSEEMKAVARECLNQIKTAATMDEFNAVLEAFEPQMKLQEVKQDFLAQCNEMLTSDEYSDETKSLIRDMISEVKAAESMDELTVQAFKIGTILSFDEILTSDEYSDELKDIAKKILDETMIASTTEECEAVMDKYAQDYQQQLEKDEAREEIKKLLPENASDAVKKIINDACNEIQTNDDPDQYAEIIETAKKAVEAQLQKDKELAPVKEAAKKAIDDAVPADASDEVKAIAEKAKKAIDAAESVADVDAKMLSGTEAIEKQIENEEAVAKEKASLKEKIANELLPAAKCDEAREILKQALADLKGAETVDAAHSIYGNALNQSKGKDSEFEGRRSGYTNAFNSALTEISTDETKAFVAEMKQALADATSIAQVIDIYESNINKIGFYRSKDGTLNGLSNYITSDEYSDELKAIAQEYYNQVKNASTMDELNEIVDKYSQLMEFPKTKEDAIAGASAVLTSDEYSDELKALAQDYIEEVKAAETMDELEAIFEKYDPLIGLQNEKDYAREEVKKLLPENASNAVKKIINDACDEIQKNDDPDQYAEVIETAKKAVEAQLQKDKELAPVKEAAKKAIDDAVPADASDEVKAIAEKAKEAIDAAESVADVDAKMLSGTEAIEEQIADEKAAELAEAKEAAKKAIDAAVPADASEEVKAEAAKAKEAIDKAESVADVNTARESGTEAIEEQIADEKAAELAEAKEAAKKAIDAAVPADASEEVKEAAEKAKAAIDAAESVADVTTAKESGAKAIEEQIAEEKAAELAEAKEAAKKAILAEQGNDTSKAVKKAVKNAIAAIDAAATLDEVNAAKKDGIAAIKAAKAGNQGQPEPVKYTIIDGANSVWTKGSGMGLLVRSDAPFAKFMSVKVDDIVIAATNYTAREGSTIITLDPAYLETLKTGEHTIEIVSTDGSASTTFTVKAANASSDPKTGDDSNILIWVLLLAASGAMLTGATAYNRKRRHR